MKQSDSPVSDSKTHSIANQNNRHDRFAAQLPIRIDTVADGSLNTDRVCESDDAHGEDQAEPLHVMCGSDAPKDQATRNEKHADTEEPEAVFGLHDAFVSSGELENKPVAYEACV